MDQPTAVFGGSIRRRVFLNGLAKFGGVVAVGGGLLRLSDNHALAEIIVEGDPRMATETISVPGAQGLSAYLAKPKSGGKHPAVVVVHESRGLTPHIKDVARRLAAAGYLALAVDYYSLPGAPSGDPAAAKAWLAAVKPQDFVAIARAAVAQLKARPDCTGKIGAIGFDWGAVVVGYLAIAEPGLNAAIAYYGRQPLYFLPDEYKLITAPLMFHYAGRDILINEGIPPFEVDLKDAGRPYELFIYPNMNHGFADDTDAADYNKDAADLAWGRTMGFLKKILPNDRQSAQQGEDR